MACETKTTTISDVEYSCTQWPPETAMLIKFRLVKAFGTAVTMLVSDKQSDGGDEIAAIGDALSAVFNNVSPEELVSLMKDCVIGASRNGEKISDSGFTQHFSGDSLADAYRLFLFVVKANYSGLMSGQLAQRALAALNQ